MKLKLTKEDYNFIECFCKKHFISAGKGLRNAFQMLIDEYKQHGGKTK